MSVIFDYFSAPSDELAAALVATGPDADSVPVPPKRGFFGRRSASVRPEAGVAYPTVDGKGIDPVVMIADLTALLTNRTYEDIESTAAGTALAVLDGGERVIWALSEVTASALAKAPSQNLAAIAGQWAEAEEFGGEADGAGLTEFLDRLTGLARDAHERGHRLYCWICV